MVCKVIAQQKCTCDAVFQESFKVHKSSAKVKAWFMLYLEYSSQIFLILYFRMESYNANSVHFYVKGLGY